MQSTIVSLSEALRAQHRSAYYHAAIPRSMPLRVYEHSTELAQLLRKRFAPCAALLTAHNPAGKSQSPVKNKKANAALLARIEALSLTWLPGYRKALKEGEPNEEGYLVFGITGGQLEALMVEFDQEAALWCPSSGTPVLMLHPLARKTYTAVELAREKILKEFEASLTATPAKAKAKAPAPKVDKKPGKQNESVTAVVAVVESIPIVVKATKVALVETVAAPVKIPRKKKEEKPQKV